MLLQCVFLEVGLEKERLMFVHRVYLYVRERVCDKDCAIFLNRVFLDFCECGKSHVFVLRVEYLSMCI